MPLVRVSAAVSIAFAVVAVGCGATVDITGRGGKGDEPGSGGNAGQAGASSASGGAGTFGGAAGAAPEPDPCETPSLPWPNGLSTLPSGCQLGAWSGHFCTDTAPGDPAWSCVEGTTGCKPDQTCFLGVAIVGECPPGATVTFSCQGLGGAVVEVTKQLPSYTVCTKTNPCVELTTGFLCAQTSPSNAGLVDPSITINGKTCELE